MTNRLAMKVYKGNEGTAPHTYSAPLLCTRWRQGVSFMVQLLNNSRRIKFKPRKEMRLEVVTCGNECHV